MTGYGEGVYRRPSDGRLLRVETRTEADIARHGWEPVCPESGEPLEPAPTPEDAAQVAETWRRLFGLLRDPELEKVALLKLEGHSLEDIAARLGCQPRSVQRQLRLIRHTWQRDGAL